MAELYNLARMSTATTGTGTITLGAPISGFLSFAASGVVNGQEISYGIADGANSEGGRGVYTATGTTLTRVVVTSTNSNTPINLSGTAQVFITPLKEDLVNTAKNLSDLASAPTARTNLGLGTAATQNTGTSGATVPLLNAANTWSVGQALASATFSSNIAVGGATLPATGRSVIAANAEIFALGVQFNSTGGPFYIGATNSATPDMVVSNSSGLEVARFAHAGNAILGGTAAADSAAAGKIGEFISSTVTSAAAVPLTNITAANVTSISLTAGDWDVNGVVRYVGASTTTINYATSSISTTSATQDTATGTDFFGNGVAYYGSINGSGFSTPVALKRISVAATTVVYLIAFANFGTSTNTAYGTIRARRVR